MSQFDPILALHVLERWDVSYVVIGGFAADLLGAPLNTNDLDICYERTSENMDRLAKALRELNATLRVARVEEPMPFFLDGKTIAAGDSFTFDTDAGSLDILATPSGTMGFKDLATDSTGVPLDDIVVKVVSVADLIRMKRASQRIKDKMHLEVLAALQEEIEEAESTEPA